MRLAYHFQGQTVKGQGYRPVGAYRVGRTRRPHCLFDVALPVLLPLHSKGLTCQLLFVTQYLEATRIAANLRPNNWPSIYVINRSIGGLPTGRADTLFMRVR